MQRLAETSVLRLYDLTQALLRKPFARIADEPRGINRMFNAFRRSRL
jgi:hypothetical protein